MNLSRKYGNWALVTGASSGIGDAFVRYLAAHGINCIALARQETRLAKLKAELETQFPVEILAVPLDLTTSDFMSTLIPKIGNRPVSILVNNAGFGTSDYFTETPVETYRAMIALNCLAPVLLTHYFLQHMKRVGKGAVIFLSSIGAVQPVPGSAVYAATKVFNSAVGEALAFEVKKCGIDVLALLPGVTKTGFQKTADFSAEGALRDPLRVVETAFRALGRKYSVIDGLQNKINSFLIKQFPGFIKLAIAHNFMKTHSTVMKG